MPRKTVYPEGHWGLKVDIPYSMGVQSGEMFFLSGQADLEGQGLVNHPNDLYKQTEAAIRHIKTVVESLGNRMDDLTKLTVFYVNSGEVNEADYINYIASGLATQSKPVITMVPLSHFFYPGVMVEIDAYGMGGNAAGLKRTSLSQPHSNFTQALRYGEMIFVGALTTVDDDGKVKYPNDIVAQSHLILEKLENSLAKLGADKRDIVKINNWYVGGGTAAQWAESAKIRANFYPDPGPVATGLPVHKLFPDGVVIQTDCWAMLSVDGEKIPKQHVWPHGHWDWPIYLPFKHGVKCRNMIFIGGQVSLDPQAKVIDPGDMHKQTRTSMENIGRVLNEIDADYADIVKVNAFYQGGNRADELHNNVNVRSGYFDKPGPASTGIPLNYLAYEDMVTEIEVIAMVGHS